MGNRSVLDGREIDCFIPAHNLGIEINGLYWHSERHILPSYHQKKYLDAKNKGVTLIQFTDWEIINKREIVHSIILNKLNMGKYKVYARECSISNITNKQYKEFLEENHIQGFTSASLKYGLFEKNILVMVMSFSRSRFSKQHEWELIRSCSKLNHNVVGGMTKLLTHFRRIYSGKLMTYVDQSHFSGSGFSGWVEEGLTQPGYAWTDGSETISRQKCQKQNLTKWLPSFDPSKSQTENMHSAGFYRIFNAGNLIFSIE